MYYLRKMEQEINPSPGKTKREKLAECISGLLEEEYNAIQASGKSVKEFIWESK